MRHRIWLKDEPAFAVAGLRRDSAGPLPDVSLYRHKRAARRGRTVGSDPVVYSVFDLLVLDGEDIRDQPVEGRKAALRAVLDCCASVLLYVPDVEDGQGLYQHAVTLGVEGVVGKRLPVRETFA